MSHGRLITSEVEFVGERRDFQTECLQVRDAIHAQAHLEKWLKAV